VGFETVLLKSFIYFIVVEYSFSVGFVRRFGIQRTCAKGQTCAKRLPGLLQANRKGHNHCADLRYNNVGTISQ
jgi:hypothetical protein